jgi:membrane dipeptidase
LKRIADKGGVIQVNFYSVFVDTDTVSPQSAARDARLKAEQDAINEKYKDDFERRAEESDKLEAANPLPPLPISKLIDHIDHIVKVAGIDHVGIVQTSTAPMICRKARATFQCCRTLPTNC